MPYDPMSFFQAGQQIGKSKNAAFTSGTNGVMDMFNKQIDNNMKISQLIGVKAAENQLPQTPKDKAETKLANKKADWMDKLSSGSITGPGDPELTLDSIGPTGPRFVNNKSRAEMAGAKKYAQNKATIDPLVASGENVLRTSVGAFKQMAANNPLGAGRGAGVLNWIGGKLGTSPAVNAYNGLKVETATELAKIANPSGRGGPEIAREFEKLLPNDFTNWEEFSNKFHYAAQNAFARQAAYNNIPYDPNDYEQKIQDILDTPAFQQMETGNKNPLQGGNPRADMANDASSTSNNSVNIEQEKSIMSQKIASGKYDVQKLRNIYKQRTGQDYV